jgi:hypothetical protein
MFGKDRQTTTVSPTTNVIDAEQDGLETRPYVLASYGFSRPSLHTYLAV